MFKISSSSPCVSFCFLFLASSFYFPTTLAGEFFPTGVGCTQFPGFNLCSGNGICLDSNNSRIYAPDVPGSRCHCDPGWTGVGDLMNMAGTDCGQNIQALRGLFGLALVLSLSTFFLSLHRLYFSYKSFVTNVRAGVRRPSGPRLSRHSLVTPLRNRGEMCMSFLRINVVPLAIMCFISSVGTLTYASVRVTDPDNQEWILGNSTITFLSRIAETALFFSSSAYFSHSWMTMTVLMCAVTGKTREEARDAVSHMKKILAGAIVTGSCMNPFFVLLIKVMPDMRLDGIFTLCYAQSAGIVGCFLFYSTFTAGNTLVGILSKGTELLPEDGRKQRLTVIGAIKRRYKISFTTTSLSLIICTVVAWWPNLRTKITWLLPIISTMNQIILSISLITLKPPQVQQKPTSSYSSDDERESGPRETTRKTEVRKTKVAKARPTLRAGPTSPSNTNTTASNNTTSITSNSNDSINTDTPLNPDSEPAKNDTDSITNGTKEQEPAVMETDEMEEQAIDIPSEEAVGGRIQITPHEYALLDIEQPRSSLSHLSNEEPTPKNRREISDFQLFVL